MSQTNSITFVIPQLLINTWWEKASTVSNTATQLIAVGPVNFPKSPANNSCSGVN